MSVTSLMSESESILNQIELRLGKLEKLLSANNNLLENELSQTEENILNGQNALIQSEIDFLELIK